MHTHPLLRPASIAAALAALTLVACGGKENAGAADTPQQPSQATGAPAAGAEQSPDPGGQVVKVEMLTDDQGNNVFRPAEVSARKGDVVRYTLLSGVHNVHFVADSNAGAQGLPAAPGEMLQLPGQTYDVKVSSAPGKYFFQCDPHALLGMVGYLTVTQ
jgi:plastocyanin